MNKSGKGGFSDNPENRSDGRWSKDSSISYWYNKLLRMDLKKFKAFKPQTMAESIAYQAVVEAVTELGHLKEVTDRTEGKPNQRTEITGKDGEPFITQPPIIVKPE